MIYSSFLRNPVHIETLIKGKFECEIALSCFKSDTHCFSWRKSNMKVLQQFVLGALKILRLILQTATKMHQNVNCS